MQNRFSRVLQLAALTLVLAGCDRSVEQALPAASVEPAVQTELEKPLPLASAEPEKPVTAAPAVADIDSGVRLAVKWPVGNRYVYRLDLTQRSTNHFPQLPAPVHEQMTLGVTYQLSVFRETEDGGRQLEFKFLAFDLEIRMSDQVVMSFASGAAPREEDRETAPFQKLIGSTVGLETDPEGRVRQVLGLDEWGQAVAGNGAELAEQMLRQQFNEGFFQQSVDLARGLPAHPVPSGASWPYRAEMPAGALGKIAVDSTITLRGWQNRDQQRLAVLEARGSLSGSPSAEPSAAATMSLEQGTVASTSWFNPSLGALFESVVDQSMRVRGEIPDATHPDRPSAIFTSDIAQRVTAKLVEWHGAEQPSTQTPNLSSLSSTNR